VVEPQPRISSGLENVVVLGAHIIHRGTSFQAVYKVTSSLDGSGASVQVSNVKATDFPLSGSDTTTTYFANGVLKTKNTFTLGTPNAKGISSLTGTGKYVGGGTASTSTRSAPTPSRAATTI
jgi:hypothetical protein